MRMYICATTKTSEKPKLVLGTTFSFTIRRGSISHLDIKRPMRSIMLREYDRRSGHRRARSPHGGIRLSSFGDQRELTSETRRLERTTPNKGTLPVFSLNGTCWKRTNCEVNRFNPKNCLDKWVHYTFSLT